MTCVPVHGFGSRQCHPALPSDVLSSSSGGFPGDRRPYGRRAVRSSGPFVSCAGHPMLPSLAFPRSRKVSAWCSPNPCGRAACRQTCQVSVASLRKLTGHCQFGCRMDGLLRHTTHRPLCLDRSLAKPDQSVTDPLSAGLPFGSPACQRPSPWRLPFRTSTSRQTVLLSGSHPFGRPA